MDHLLYQIICLKMGPNSLVHRPQEICDASKGRLVSTLYGRKSLLFLLSDTNMP